MKREKKDYNNFWDFNFDKMFQFFKDEMDTIMKSTSSIYEDNGPITYGYSYYIGPETNNQPEIRQWGNLNDYRKKQGLPKLPYPFSNSLKPLLASSSEHSNELNVDFIDENDSLRIIVEVPGFNKDDFTIEINENGSEILLNGTSELKEINQVIKLPSKIEPNTSKSTIKNGVLEIRAKKLEELSKKYKVKID